MMIERNAKGKRPLFYQAEGMDQAMSMILVLANEMMVVRDRLDTVEKIAESKGIILAAEIETFEPNQKALEARESRRQDFLARLYYLARKQAAELATGDDEERYKSALEDIAASL